MAVLIGGHQRSGTTMLKDLFNSHPQAFITGEFGNFMHLDLPFDRYARYIWSRWWQRRNAAILKGYPVKGANMLRNMVFCTRYLNTMRRLHPDVIDSRVIDETLRKVAGKTVVGDKYPDYVFVMNRLAAIEDLRVVTIYRDPRDMASSAFKRARQELVHHWPDELRDPSEVARRWIHAVRMIEEYNDKLFAICYEDFVLDPSPTLDRLSDWLGLERSGFKDEMILSTSIGKHRSYLTDQEIDQILEIAGPTMQRLGYQV